MHQSARDLDAADIAMIEQLYARQSHAFDSGDAAGWAGTFTPDGEFVSPTYGAPVVGYQQLRDFAEARAAALRAERRVERHILSNLALTAYADGTVHARAYLLMVGTTPGGQPQILRSALLDDVVASMGAGGGWQVRSRRVTRDDLLAGA